MRTQKYFLLILSTLVAAQHSFAQNLKWINSVGNNTIYNDAANIGTDKFGNIYLFGTFGGTIDIDPGPGNTQLISKGNTDNLIEKLDSNGNLIWAKTFGNVGKDNAKDLAVDSLGYTFMIGEFSDSVDFDPGPDSFKIFSQKSLDTYILKLDPNGNFVWAKSLKDDASVVGNGIKVDKAGNVYCTGEYYWAAVDFDPGPATHIVDHHGLSSMYLLKLDRDGNFIWVNNAPTSYGDSSCTNSSVYVDKSDNVYTIGTFRGTIDFDPGPSSYRFTSTPSANSGPSFDIYVQKFNAAGQFVWARMFGGPDYDFSGKIVTDDSLNVLFLGAFIGTSDFDPGVNTANLTTHGNQDMVIVKLNASGNYLWAKNFGGKENTPAYSLDVDKAGNIYTTGYFSDTVDFDPGPDLYNLVAYNTIFSSMFVQKLNNQGGFQWASAINGQCKGRVVYVTKAQDILIAGTSNYGYWDFDPGPGVYLSGGSTTSRSLFLTKWSTALNSGYSEKWICQGSNTIISISNPKIGDNYQWQINTGGGFVNITPSVIFSGTTNDTLFINNPPSNLAGVLFRCVITNPPSNISTTPAELHFTNTWVGTISNEWEIPGNWSCGVVPDQYTDVIISNGHPIINSSQTIRSASVTSNANLKINQGFNLKIIH